MTETGESAGPADPAGGGEDRGGDGAGDARDWRPRLGPVETLADAVWMLRSRPVAAVPFLLLGGVVALYEVVRLRDAVPIAPVGPPRQVWYVQPHPYPRATRALTTEPGALVGLEPSYLVWVLGFGGVVVLATAAATAATISVVAGGERSLRTTARLGVYQAAVVGCVGAGAVASGRSTVLALAVGVVVAGASVKLFLVPALVTWGLPVREAVAASWRRTRGNHASLVAVVLVVGVASGLLASAPGAVGPVPERLARPLGVAVATAVVGPVHALLVARAADRLVDA